MALYHFSVYSFYDEVTNGRNVAVLDELLAPNFEGFTVEGADHGQNREEFKQTMTMVLNAFPDHHQTIHDWIAENDKVVTVGLFREHTKASMPVLRLQASR